MSRFEHTKHFTPEEASALIPKITPLLLKMQLSLEAFEKQRLKAVAALKRAGTNGKRYAQEEPDALVEIQELTNRVEGFGVIVKDYALGLIDFPSVRNAQEVYLCWKIGEPVVSHWHEIDSGFSGRKPV